ncbi:MAG: 2OG-Fe(II) oxygenase family protein [Dongiaceae bacterium]
MKKIEQISATLSFASPICWFKLPDSDQLNVDLLRDGQAWRTVSGGVTVSNQNGWHSDPVLFQRPEASFRAVCDAIRECVRAVTRNCAPTFDFEKSALFCEGWINMNPKGGYNSPHRHTGFLWSGTYYVQVPETNAERSGSIEFIDPRSRNDMHTIRESDLFATKLTFHPEAGHLVIFPSYLLHWVYPNEEAQERVSIAFNARFGKPKKAAPQG